MGRNIRLVNLGNITGNLVVTFKVGLVCLTRELVPLACEYAFASDTLESHSQATDSGKKINECERRFRFSIGDHRFIHHLQQPVNNSLSWYCFTFFPPVNGSRIISCKGGNIGDGQTCFFTQLGKRPGS